MKYFMLIWAGLWRKKMRTIFTMLAIVMAFLLFGLLQGINSGFDKVAGDVSVKRLYASNKNNQADGMPISYAERIAADKGVTNLSPAMWFFGFYQDKRNAIAVWAADVPKFFEIYKDVVKIPKEQVDAMRTTRTGALISRNLATRYGWKVGDTVPLSSSIWLKKDGRADYHFEIVGVYDVIDGGAALMGPNNVYINFNYFDEARQYGTGMIVFYVIGINAPSQVEETISRIVELFDNSSYEIKAESEQAFAGNFLKQVADINLIVNAIVAAVLMTLLFLTGNTMMQSIHERIPELAVLKTLGFTDGTVSLLVLCESLLLCVGSALVGLGLGRLAFLPMRSVFGGMQFHATVIYLGIALATGLAIVSGAPPALRAKYLSIADSLAGR